MRGATELSNRINTIQWISIHAPCEGSDVSEKQLQSSFRKFQSTLPVRGATQTQRKIERTVRFQSTLPVRGATFTLFMQIPTSAFQSTLPVRGATATKASSQKCVQAFQSTLPVRGATVKKTNGGCADSISIHAPCEGSDHVVILRVFNRLNISIHAPCEGSDHRRKNVNNRVYNFNPRSL